MLKALSELDLATFFFFLYEALEQEELILIVHRNKISAETMTY